MSKRILVVDDDPDAVTVARTVLESAGYTVEGAANGDEAFSKIAKKRPDLIILDVMMRSDTEGFHVSYKLRSDKDLKNIPVIMLSAIGQKTGMEFAPEKDEDYLPVEEFISKPMEPADLLAKVGRLIGKP
ncbi:MAG: response regulator [Planctomycetota bacterium]